MKLYFKVPPEADGMLLRGFLRRCSVSTDLSRAVKFRGSGFFADGAPVLANRRVEAGQVISFELPPEGEGVVPQDDIPVDVVCLLYTSPSPRDASKSRMPSSA